MKFFIRKYMIKVSNKEEDAKMDDVNIIDLEDLLDFKQTSMQPHNCGPSHSCGGGR